VNVLLGCSHTIHHSINDLLISLARHLLSRIFQLFLMVWLLYRVVRDRPGILSEIASILRSWVLILGIRNVVGNSQALMLEVEGGVI